MSHKVTITETQGLAHENGWVAGPQKMTLQSPDGYVTVDMLRGGIKTADGHKLYANYTGALLSTPAQQVSDTTRAVVQTLDATIEMLNAYTDTVAQNGGNPDIDTYSWKLNDDGRRVSLAAICNDQGDWHFVLSGHELKQFPAATTTARQIVRYVVLNMIERNTNQMP